MKLSDIIDALVEAGATPAMIAAAVRASEADANAKLSQRRANDAERQRRSRMSRNVTVTERDTPSLSAKTKSAPTPPEKTQPPIPAPSPSIISPAPRLAFDQFWEAYPRKASKRAAEKAFAGAIKRASLTAILEGVERAKPGRQWRDGFTPHPATWLNADGWLDEIDATPGPERQRNWRELEAENNRNALLGAKLALEGLEHDSRSRSREPEDSRLPNGAGLALPAPNENAARAGDIVAGLSRGLSRVHP